MTEAELKKHIETAEKSPKEIAAAVSGLSAEVLRYKPAPDKWSILEILGHLADIEIVYAYRLRQMLADEKPVIAPMDQDAWARHLGYTEIPAPELVAAASPEAHRLGEVGVSSRTAERCHRCAPGGADVRPRIRSSRADRAIETRDGKEKGVSGRSGAFTKLQARDL